MAKTVCDHCGLEYPDEVMIKEEVDGTLHHFCCRGCQGVYHLLGSEGLDSFYSKVGDVKLSPPKEFTDDVERFDLESFTKKYVKQEGDFSSIALILEGIHCAACVWLNERVLTQLDGIVDANINFTTHKAKITWDHTKLTLSKIIETIRAIGYNAYPYDPASGEERANKQRREYISRMAVALVATMNIMWLALSRYVGFFSGMEEDIRQLIYVAEFILATPVLFYSGWIYYRGAYYGLRNRIINMDLLVATGASAAYFYSIYAAFVLGAEPYFDSVAMIITFVLIGKFFEVRSKKSAVDAIDTMVSSIPQEIIVVKDGIKMQKSIEEVMEGDLVECRAGDKIIFDSTIEIGDASIDTSSITGESIPETAGPGDTVISGSINLDGTLLLKVEKDYHSSTLYSIITLIEDAINKKPKIEQLANRVSEYFSMTILSIAVLAFIGWYFIMDGSFEASLLITISVVIVACPCALALATPIATLVGIGTAMKRGVLFKATQYIETLAKADVLLMDKTGTLTKGRPEVLRADIAESDDLKLVYSLVEGSNHPVSKGVANYLKHLDDTVNTVALEQVKSIQARGVSAQYEGKRLVGGNVAFLREEGVACDIVSEHLLFVCAVDGAIVATFELDDPAKEDAADMVGAMRSMGLEVMMLTGDHEASAERIAQAVGIDTYRAGMMPTDKADMVDRLHEEGKVVVMVGDGVNDSVALSKADIAIAMHSGADVAIDVSDIVVLDDRLASLKAAFLLGRRTYGFIKQNMAISLAYNTVTIPLAVAGYIIPLVAAIAMSLSSLMVVANSMRIKNIKG